MEKKKDILLINPPSTFGAYEGTKVSAAVQVYPLLSFMCLGAALKRAGFEVGVVDLGIEAEPYEVLEKTIAETKPSFVGITSPTPLFFEVAEISRRAKEKLGDKVKVIYGGPHATALPEESLEKSTMDVIVIGEGEETIVEICQGKSLKDIRGICYKEENRIICNPPRPLIGNLDSLPFPALDLYDLKRYKSSKLVSGKSPVSSIETSRGCPRNCSFCNKNISGRVFRTKSPERVIEEFKYFLNLGIKGFRVIDDQFAANIDRAKRICEMILKENLHFSWILASGIRVDGDYDLEFFKLLKKTGCRDVGIGFESGDQKSLDSIDKGITLEQSMNCMKLIKKAGLETVGFFMLGLPTDTEESLKKTIKFAIKLSPDLAKATITIPFPGTRLFEQYEKEGRIKTRDWSKYNIHKVADVYEHPNLSQETLKKYYDLFYWRFYFAPKFLFRRIFKGIITGRLFLDIYYGLRTFFPKIFSHKVAKPSQ